MTSSFKIQQRLREGNLWKFGLADSQMGGQDDSYLRSYGECHPDFMAIPIGNPTGVKMCVRRVDPYGRRFGETPTINATKELVDQKLNGYWRASPNLYDPRIQKPVQLWNPDAFPDRRTPYEQDLLRDDYLRWPVKYNGNGINLNRAPAEGKDTGHAYYQYGDDFTPMEDHETGRRIATSMKDNVPRPKYDITRLVQPYPIWKRAQSAHGRGQAANSYDTNYFERIV
jgi:hypothetical protein